MSGGLSRLRGYLSRTAWLSVLEGSIAALAIWAHVRLITKIPMGFYTDEVSIGYNAHLIGTTGHDEFGVSWPLYTESVGDYKNPVYVYLEVLVMRIFGCSTWTLRLPSALCWLVGSCLLYALGRRLWSTPQARILLLLSVAFTPSLFCLSRIAFEIIALYPVLALFLLAIQRGFEGNSVRWAVVAGLAIGMSTYVYTTFRLLAPLHCVLVLACYCKREYFKRLFAFGAAAFSAVLPFGWYLHVHGDQLTRRYQSVGFADKPMPLLEKLKLFAQHYAGYFDANYLLLQGDPNTRHHTGYGGELLFPTALGLVIGVAAISLDRRERAVRFDRVLLGGLLLSPVAAALTTDEHHSLRAFSLVVFAIVLSVSGFHYALRMSARPLWILVAASLALCSALFVKDYFGPYAAKSIPAFQYFGFRPAIYKAMRAHATRIVVDSRRHGRHADLHANFVSVLLADEPHPPLVAGRPADVQPGEAFVFEDAKNEFPDLHEGLPQGSLYVTAPYERVIMLSRKRARR